MSKYSEYVKGENSKLDQQIYRLESMLETERIVGSEVFVEADIDYLVGCLIKRNASNLVLQFKKD